MTGILFRSPVLFLMKQGILFYWRVQKSLRKRRRLLNMGDYKKYYERAYTRNDANPLLFYNT